MISDTELASLVGNTMVGQGGHKIGRIVDVYESTDGAEGTFVTASTGHVAGAASFVPLSKATLQGNQVVVSYAKDLVEDAPRVEADLELTSTEEDRLYRHYGLAAAPVTTATAGRHEGETAIPRSTDRNDGDGDGVFDDVKDTAVGRDTSGLTTDDAMTRSEERLQVGVQTREAGRARLRKRIVSETVSQTVPVSHQSATVVREPVTAEDMPTATDGPALSEQEHEVVLLDELPVVVRQTVPVERVRLDTETTTEQTTVNEQVRKEQIEVDDPTTTSRTGRSR